MTKFIGIRDYAHIRLALLLPSLQEVAMASDWSGDDDTVVIICDAKHWIARDN